MKGPPYVHCDGAWPGLGCAGLRWAGMVGMGRGARAHEASFGETLLRWIGVKVKVMWGLRHYTQITQFTDMRHQVWNRKS
jgi:hypothetical protein